MPPGPARAGPRARRGSRCRSRAPSGMIGRRHSNDDKCFIANLARHCLFARPRRPAPGAAAVRARMRGWGGRSHAYHQLSQGGSADHHACHQQPAGRRNSSPRAPVTALAVSEERRASVRAPFGARRSSSPTRRGVLWPSAPPPPRSSRSSSARLPAPARPPSLLLRRGVAVARQPARWPQPRRPTLLAAAR